MADDLVKGNGIRWMLRPVVWFATAYMIIIIFHEAAHAITAVMFGFPSTLFNFWVDYRDADATASERAIVGIAGPAISLIAGLVCWGMYQRFRNSAMGLPLLYLTAFGMANFFGNLMSVAFFGDFSNAAVVLGLSQVVRVVAAITGAVSVAGIVFLAGRELWQWTPHNIGRIGGMLGLIVMPSLIGTMLIIVINEPTPMGASFASARAVEAAFWLFAVVGLLTTRQSRALDMRPLRLHWADGVVAVFVLLSIRLMARGIALS